MKSAPALLIHMIIKSKCRTIGFKHTYKKHKNFLKIVNNRRKQLNVRISK